MTSLRNFILHPLDGVVARLEACVRAEVRGGKPLAFVAHLFRALGAEPGDSLDDLYPGTGIVGRCWTAWTKERETR